MLLSSSVQPFIVRADVIMNVRHDASAKQGDLLNGYKG